MKSWFGVGLFTLFLAACNGARPELVSETLGQTPEEGKQTAVIKPISPEAAMAFRITPAPVDTVQVHAERATTKGAAVEVLVKGYLADGCTELHEVAQSRESQTIRVNVLVRRKTEAMCTMAVRPYKFYLKLNDRLTSGSYNLALNNHVYPFKVN